MDWIHLALNSDQQRVLANMVMNFQVPYNVGKFFNWQLLKRTQLH
jgi:hypothetical protein